MVTQFLDRDLSPAIEQLLNRKSFAILKRPSQIFQNRVRCFPSDQSAFAQSVAVLDQSDRPTPILNHRGGHVPA